jgi:adenine C2-methylase RlmN of 23S rRNA A2503 and tRNA A37
MFSIHDESQIVTLLESNGHKKFRYAQIENALYKNLLMDFEAMETLPKDIRELLSKNCFYTSLTLHSEKTDPE